LNLWIEEIPLADIFSDLLERVGWKASGSLSVLKGMGQLWGQRK
jgi:hypothetical protein